jgi:hypothetical protein
MRIDRIAAGDIVLCSVGGRRIYGEVTEIVNGVLHFQPLSRAAGWRHATARQIIGHWRKTGRRGQGVASGEPEADEPVRQPPEQLSLPLHT